MSNFSAHEFSLSTHYKYKLPDTPFRDSHSALGPGFYLQGGSAGVKMGGTAHLEKLLRKTNNSFFDDSVNVLLKQ